LHGWLNVRGSRWGPELRPEQQGENVTLTHVVGQNRKNDKK